MSIETKEERLLSCLFDHYTHYECTVYYDSTGSSHTKEYPFTEIQASSVHEVLTEKGIPIAAALRLIEGWNKRGTFKGIRYSYRLAIKPRTV